jgi:hypothetical protein
MIMSVSICLWLFVELSPTVLGSIAKLPARIQLTVGGGTPLALQNTVTAEPGNTSTSVLPCTPWSPVTTIYGAIPKSEQSFTTSLQTYLKYANFSVVVNLIITFEW